MTRERDHSWRKDRVARAYRLMQSDIGRQAAAEEWIIGLFDFCRINSRWPDEAEATAIKDLSYRAERELAAIGGVVGGIARSAQRARIEKLKRMVTQVDAA